MEKNVNVFRHLQPEQQAELLGHTLVLLDEKNWEGCGGLELTDEIRVTVAAHAARLLLGRPAEYFPRIRSVLIYPQDFLHTAKEHLGSGIYQESEVPVAGLAHGRMGVVILSWSAALRSIGSHAGGSNVVLHEFAHELDYEDGTYDGTPPLESRAAYAAWASTLQPEFDALRRGTRDGVIDSYGATNPAEFFAVATESFFERPRALRKKHPALYEQLASFYQQDPVTYT